MPLLQKKDIWLSQLKAGIITPEQYANRVAKNVFNSGSESVVYANNGLVDIDPSDISSVVFTLYGGDEIIKSFAHTHPEYLLTKDPRIPNWSEAYSWGNWNGGMSEWVLPYFNGTNLVDSPISLSSNDIIFDGLAKVHIKNTSSANWTSSIGDAAFNVDGTIISSGLVVKGTTELVGDINTWNSINFYPPGGIMAYGSVSTSSDTGLYIMGNSNLHLKTGWANHGIAIGKYDINTDVPFTILDTTNSTSPTTGALIIDGGVGIAKDLFVGNNISAKTTILSNLTNSVLPINDNSVGLKDSPISVDNNGNIKVAGNLYATGEIQAWSDDGSGLPQSLLDALPIATTSSLGIMQVGSGLSVTNGVVSVSGDLTGQNAEWGYISGTLSNQTDLKNALDTKLDSVVYTAVDILSKIKTVDGSGSGLDADLLDGKDLAYFMPASGVYNSQITISTVSPLNSGGVFTLNQSSNKTIEIGHNEISVVTTTNNVNTGYGDTFSIIDNISDDGFGHITGFNVKSVKLPDTDKLVNINSSDISNVVFSLNNGDVITTSFAHTHPEYYLNNTVSANVIPVNTTNKLEDSPISVDANGNVKVTGNLYATGEIMAWADDGNGLPQSLLDALPIATTSSLGIMQVGNGLSVADGVVSVIGDGTAAIWGQISGTLSNQTDLQDALDAKQDKLTGTGFVKAINGVISYDSQTYYPSSNPNNYQTHAEVLADTLDGFTAATSKINLSSASTILSAFEALEYRVNINDGKISNVTTDISIVRDDTSVTVVSSDGENGVISVADTTNAGVMSAAMVSKLNGIEDGATADQTPNEILTAIKTVDGTNSGLDADLLDGKEGTYYLDYSHLTNKPAINNPTITLSAGNVLTGGGSFTLNQALNTTITFNHATITPNITQNYVTLGVGDDFTAYSSIGYDNYGHYVSANATTFSISDSVANKYKVVDIDGTDISNVQIKLNNGDTLVGSFAHTHPEYMLQRQQLTKNYLSYWEGNSFKDTDISFVNGEYYFGINAQGGGKVVIGADSSSQNILELDDYSGDPIAIFKSGNDFYSDAVVKIGDINECTDGLVLHWDFDNDKIIVENGDFKVNGNALATGELTAWTSSDIRLKKNIYNIENALSVVDELRPVTFNWNKKALHLNKFKPDTKNYGLIAQELETILPELVHPIYDKYKGIDYIQLVPILVQAIKELKREVEYLKQK